MKRKPYRYFLYLGLRVLEALVSRLPRQIALSLAAGIGELAFFVARRERKKTLEHLRLAYGAEKSDAELEGLGKRVFRHFAQAAVDMLRLPRLRRQELEPLIEVGDSFSILDRVLSRGRGGIILTAHLGNWELMGAYLRLRGYPGALVGRRIYYDKFDEFLVNLRLSAQLRTIYQDAPAREFLKVLHQNELLGILADQDIDRFDGIFVPFFGRPAYTLTAPVKMALASGAPLIPTFLVRKGNGYRFLVEEPIEVQMRGSREETIREYTERWSRVMEEKIRAYPDQWVWMHRRWKTVPAAGTIRESLNVGDAHTGG